MKFSTNNKIYCPKMQKAVQWLRCCLIKSSHFPWSLNSLPGFLAMIGHITETCFHFGTSRPNTFLKTPAVLERKNFLQWYTPFFLLCDPHVSVKQSSHTVRTLKVQAILISNCLFPSFTIQAHISLFHYLLFQANMTPAQLVNVFCW